jgi:hypothetical protein
MSGLAVRLTPRYRAVRMKCSNCSQEEDLFIWVRKMRNLGGGVGVGWHTLWWSSEATICWDGISAPSSGCSSSAYPARSGEGRSGCGCTRASTATAPSGSSFGWPSPLPSSTPAEESTRTTSSALYPGRHGPRGGPRRGGILDVGEDARGNKRKEKNRKRWSLSLDESRRSQLPTKSGVTGTALHKNR